MLHRTRAERVDAGVDGIILLRETHIVANGLRLGESWQTDGLAPLQASQPRLRFLRLFKIHPGCLRRADLENKRLLNRKSAVARERVNVGRWFRMIQRKVFRHLNHEGPPS